MKSPTIPIPITFPETVLECTNVPLPEQMTEKKRNRSLDEEIGGSMQNA